MKKKEMEERIKGLEGLIESQRNTIKLVSEHNKELINKLENRKERKEYLIGLFTRDISDYFHIDLSEEELKVVKGLNSCFKLSTGAEMVIYTELKEDD